MILKEKVWRIALRLGVSYTYQRFAYNINQVPQQKYKMMKCDWLVGDMDSSRRPPVLTVVLTVVLSVVLAVGAVAR